VPDIIVLLSGPVGAGKTELADRLAERYGFETLSTRKTLTDKSEEEVPSRKRLQALGQSLDQKTSGRWVYDALARYIQAAGVREPRRVVVDAVRIKKQIDPIRQGFGRCVMHVHLTASDATLNERYAKRDSSDMVELGSYEEVKESAVEAAIEDMAKYADIVITTDRCTEDDVLVRVAAHLKLYAPICERLVDVVVGGQYGSEGKGHICQYLAPEYHVLVRVGGPNAGHTVYEEPEPYKFHMLPSGTRANENAKLIIGAGAVLNVKALRREIFDCAVPEDRLVIDPQAMVIIPSDIKAEKKGKDAIGSTGQGVGSATARKIMVRFDDPKRHTLADKEDLLTPFIAPAHEALEQAYKSGKRVLLEGTQGTELSIHHGKYPYVTSRNTTVAGCLAEAGISPSRVRRVIMVCRTYPIRVQNPKGGTSGPFSQVTSWAEISRRCGIASGTLRKHERTTTTNRRRRVGEFDWVSLRKAAALNAPTDIALTFVDYLSSNNANARRYEQLEEETIRFIEEVEIVAGAPVSLISTRFDYRSIIDRRHW